MWNKFSIVVTVALVLGVLGCSDSGDDVPTGPSTTTTPQLSVGDIVFNEGDTAIFVVQASGAPASDITFSISILALSATAADFSEAGTVATLDSGTLSTEIPVTITDDIIAEGSELFQLTISSVSGATIVDSTAVCRITPNDGGVDVNFVSELRPLFQSRCATSGCHAGSAGGFSMGAVTAADLRAASGDHGPVMIVGNGPVSSLYTKTTSSPPFNSQMPLIGGALQVAEQERIRDWISQGARE